MSEALVAQLRGRIGQLEMGAALDAPAGAVTALVGPSGSGKTTVLRALAGLLRLEGEVRIGSEVWQAAGRFTPPHRRAVGYVAQGAPLLPHLSVRGNLDYGRRRAGASSGELHAAVERLGIGALLERAPERLSGGERQRVALARALVTRPAVLLLDEPLSGLDADAKDHLLPELRAVFTHLSVPVLYVSHDRAEVARVADRVLRIEAGRLGTGRQ